MLKELMALNGRVVFIAGASGKNGRVIAEILAE